MQKQLFPVNDMLTLSNISYYYSIWATLTEACKDIVSQANDCDNRELIYHRVQELYDIVDQNPSRAYELANRQKCEPEWREEDDEVYNEWELPF